MCRLEFIVLSLPMGRQIYNTPTQRQLLPAGGGVSLAVYLEK